MNFEVEERVDRLETLLGQFIIQTNTSLNRLSREVENLSIEMKVFKDEMGDFKNEMRDYKDSQQKQTLNMNKQRGELANKMGTMVEDLVIPSVSRIIDEKFEIEIEDLTPRHKRKLADGRTKEFDLIAISGECVFLNSTKSTLNSKDVNAFVKEISQFLEFFPEYRSKKLIGLLASLYVDKSVMSYAERKGFLVLAVGMEIMEIKNRPDFEPKRWIYNA
ncbi:hypothetical protein H8E88_25290 [candidate division KSB1 bacterium]|nr:hypothetical protein [candidate division KSB1 bacterium]MBL7094960.1 hypothetical protein [candidate division KSB1 bacterium]